MKCLLQNSASFMHEVHCKNELSVEKGFLVDFQPGLCPPAFAAKLKGQQNPWKSGRNEQQFEVLNIVRLQMCRLALICAFVVCIFTLTKTFLLAM